MSLSRAYATLEIKSIDEDKRIIEGVASTPTTDRAGDIVDPLGAKFSLPLPLLWQHRSDQPIGHVISAKATKAGITIRAQIAKDVLPRIDEAWALIKAGLVRGLSIGFNALESARIDNTYGLHFTSWEFLELSCVTIPMNADATITAIKSLDAQHLAASGRAASRTQPGVSGHAQRATMNIAQQLTAAKAAQKTKSDRLAELRTKSEAEGGLEPAEQTERTGIVDEIKALNTDIDELSALEGAQASQAKALVVPKSQAQAGGGLDAREVAKTTTDTRPKGIAFAQMVRCKMAAHKYQRDPVQIAKEIFPDDPRIQVLLKAGTTPFTSADGSNTGGTELVYAQNLVSEFIEWLRPQTIIGKFGQGVIPSLNLIPFNVRITGQTSGGSAGWVGQNVQKPVTKWNHNAVTHGYAKLAAIAVMSDELARFSNPSADMLVRNELGAVIRERVDIDFIDPDKAMSANVSPASITNGVAALASAGSDAVDVRADIKSLVTNFIDANMKASSLVFIMTDTTALSLSLMRNGLGQKEFPDITMNGGSLEGIPVIVSEYARHGSPSNPMVIAVSAADIFLSDDGQISVDMSREASIEMATDPVNDSGTVVSMFQNNLMALRAERYINWSKKRSTAAAFIRNVTWGEGSPA